MNYLKFERHVNPIGRSLMIALPKAWCRMLEINGKQKVDAFVTEEGLLIKKKVEIK